MARHLSHMAWASCTQDASKVDAPTVPALDEAMASNNSHLLRVALARYDEVRGVPEQGGSLERKVAKARTEQGGSLERKVAKARTELRRLSVLQSSAADPKAVKSEVVSQEKRKHSGAESANKRLSVEKDSLVDAESKREQDCMLQISPSQGICFGARPSEERKTMRPLRLVNSSSSRVAFKVKLTQREFYLVEPRCCGALFPGEVRDLRVVLKPMWQKMGLGSRRLVVQEMVVGPVEEVPRNIWKDMRERVLEHRIDIVFGETCSSSRD